ADIEGFAKSGEVYTYAKHGFEATEYILRTDQLGTQLDLPAHWAPEYPAIDELPATYAMRPLVVISIVERLKPNSNYALQVSVPAMSPSSSRLFALLSRTVELAGTTGSSAALGLGVRSRRAEAQSVLAVG